MNYPNELVSNSLKISIDFQKRALSPHTMVLFNQVYNCHKKGVTQTQP